MQPILLNWAANNFYGWGIVGLNLLLLPLSMFALLAFTGALTLWVAALNVRYRDTQHLLNLALLTWFWVTPVVYPSAFAFKALGAHGSLFRDLYLSNPMTAIALGFHPTKVLECQPQKRSSRSTPSSGS